jgi:hypothetical protein
MTRAVMMTLISLGLVVACGQAPADVGPGIEPTSEANFPELSQDDDFDTAAEVRAQLPSALEAFDGNFPDASRSRVLVRLQRTFDQQRRNLAADEGTEPGLYERGAAEGVVLDVWLCSWEGAFLAAERHDNSADMERAGTQLATWYDLAYAKRWVDDPEHGWEREVLAPAMRGDTRAMAADYKYCIT